MVETKGGQQYLSLFYRQSKTATSNFQVQTNTTLNPLDWTTRTDIVDYGYGDIGNAWIRKVSVPIDDENSRLFIRLSTNADGD